MKRVVIFDLDETVVDSAHRTPNHPDGTLNLPLYLTLKTRENTLRDKLLPLAKYWKSLDLSETYVVSTSVTIKMVGFFVVIAGILLFCRFMQSL